MYIMYVDESGDPGSVEGASKHYILSGLIVNSKDWSKCLTRLKAFRKSLKETYDLSVKVEIHASELIRINDIDAYKAIKKDNRIKIMKDFASQIPIIFDTCKVVNICIHKESHPLITDYQTMAWSRLISRFDTFMKKDGNNEQGIIIADDSNEITLRNLLRKMRVYNPIKSRFQGYYNAPADNIIEDVFYRGSHNSYFIQTVDTIAHILYRKEYPKGSLRKYGLEILFNRIEPILLKAAAANDRLGIVRN